MELITVEVCYAEPDEQVVLMVTVPEGSSVIKVILASDILSRFPTINLTDNVGINSKKVPLTQVVQLGDRIEIYRPLILTPNELRLKRARKTKDS